MKKFLRTKSVSQRSLFEYEVPKLLLSPRAYSKLKVGVVPWFVCASVSSPKWSLTVSRMSFRTFEVVKCFIVLPWNPQPQSSLGQRCREKVNTSMIDYIFFFFFFRNPRNALGTPGASSQFKTFLPWKAFQCCWIGTVLICFGFNFFPLDSDPPIIRVVFVKCTLISVGRYYSFDWIKRVHWE